MQFSFLTLPATTALTLILAAACSACGGGSSAEAPPAPVPDTWAWSLPEGFSPPVVPENNPMSEAKVELGRHLFHEPRLSVNGTLSCAGCHASNLAFSDNRALGRGATSQNHPRNSPGLINVAYNLTLDWANPAPRTLEAQMHGPVFNTSPIELGINDSNREQVLQRLKDDSQYPARFAAAFAKESTPIHWDNVIKAIAAFERTIISANSRYDQARAGTSSLSATEQRGQQLFFGERALCAQCHAGPNLGGGAFAATNGISGSATFYNIGLFNMGGTGAYPEPNRGLFEFTKRLEDMGKFRPPSLRNIELTAPYLHDGSAATLEAVLDIHAAGGREVGNGPYAGDGRANPYKDPLINKIQITEQDKSDLVAFLKTLTDTSALNNPRFSDPFSK
ncbi:methanobactin export MATE transporter MbnM [Ottowia thiooxydans]|uniref:methanobactin export MATE transporter MbnM n=1 Tax=Ottowia thiooxydans TaxID=219182 RepID=UPI00041ABD5C|nr:methanobactin export MATE transporter MbnM [Ottowia thiooxydans]